MIKLFLNPPAMDHCGCPGHARRSGDREVHTADRDRVRVHGTLEWTFHVDGQPTV
jgi:hypothetical protein